MGKQNLKDSIVSYQKFVHICSIIILEVVVSLNTSSLLLKNEKFSLVNLVADRDKIKKSKLCTLS